MHVADLTVKATASLDATTGDISSSTQFLTSVRRVLVLHIQKTNTLFHQFYQTSSTTIVIHPDLHQVTHSNKDVTTNACRFSHRDAGTYPIRAEER